MSKHLYTNYKGIWEQCNNTMDSLFYYIKDYPIVDMDTAGNITVCNTKDGSKLPVFCCHLDTVHNSYPKPVLLKEDILISLNESGIGGDDKCGIVACLEMLQKVPCKCIFFRAEESGCIGSKKYDAKSLKKNLFCIEIDRKGAKDLIFSSYAADLCSDEFQERVKKAFPHGEGTKGLLTDVCVLDKANINMMNLSAGYYNPHTTKEYVVLSELQRNIECLEKLTNDIVENPLKEKTYKRSKITYAYQTTTEKDWSGYETGLFQGDVTGDCEDDDFNLLQYGSKKAKRG